MQLFARAHLDACYAWCNGGIDDAPRHKCTRHTDGHVAGGLVVVGLGLVGLGVLGLLFNLDSIAGTLVLAEDDGSHTKDSSSQHTPAFDFAALVELADTGDDGHEDGGRAIGAADIEAVKDGLVATVGNGKEGIVGVFAARASFPILIDQLGVEDWRVDVVGESESEA